MMTNTIDPTTGVGMAPGTHRFLARVMERMRLTSTRIVRLALVGPLIGAVVTLGACGDDLPVVITGTAATGAPMADTVVTVVNAAGQTSETRTDAQGRFRAEIRYGAPYLLRATDAAGASWYSYAPETLDTVRANITPITTLAVLDAAGNRPLTDLFSQWQQRALPLSTLVDSAQRVNANLAAQLRAQGLDARTLNPFTAEFAADRQGLDAVLDSIRVALNCSGTACAPFVASPTTGQALMAWNRAISTAGFSISWGTDAEAALAAGGSPVPGGVPVVVGPPTTSPPAGGTATGGTLNVSLGACAATARAGTYSMVIRTVAAGFPIPEVCIDGLDAKPTSQSDFCGSSTVSSQLPAGISLVGCSWADPTGTISAAITAPIAIDYLITYTFVRR